MERFELRNKIQKKYELENGQRITIKRLIEISENEKIDLKDLILILGCYKNAKYKTPESWTTIRMNQEYTKRELVNLIKIELKYLQQYGSRMYKKQEVYNICEKYGIEIDDFLTYIYNFKICYYENSYILSMNKEGIWIGESPALSKDFIDENYTDLYKKITKAANKMQVLYGSRVSKEEMIDIGMDYILKQGKIEKNLAFDKERLIGKLLFKARYQMLGAVIKSFKETSISALMDFIGMYDEMEYVDKIDSWIYPIKWRKIEKLIIDNIQLNINAIMKNREYGLRNITKKLDMQKDRFYQIIESIGQQLIQQNKVRICKDGRVVIINEQI